MTIVPLSDHAGSIVLVVDDDPAILEVIQNVLERAGYTVILANDGSQALMLCEEFGQTPDLILTDIKMPEVSGGEMVRELSAGGKIPRVLFMSGFADETVRSTLADGKAPFLQKPFTIEELTRKVGEVLAMRP